MVSLEEDLIERGSFRNDNLSGLFTAYKCSSSISWPMLRPILTRFSSELDKKLSIPKYMKLKVGDSNKNIPI